MTDSFSFLAAVIALSSPLIAGPAGPLSADQGLALQGSERAGASVSADVIYAGGETVGRLGNDKITVSIDDIPDTFIKALIAVEDANFRVHQGIDPTGTARAALGVASGRNLGGGSTLTQQLAKNTVTGSELSFERKLEEMISAVVTESIASKDEILESYTNAVFFGRRAEGAALAAENWFGKDWSDLELDEYAFLAGVLQAPSALDPRKNYDAALERRNHVLRRMAVVGFITESQASLEIEKPLVVIDPPPPPKAPPLPETADFWALIDARRFLDVSRLDHVNASGGFRTTLRKTYQQAAQSALDAELGVLNAALGERPITRIDARSPIDEETWKLIRAKTPFIPADARRAIFVNNELVAEDETKIVLDLPSYLEEGGVYIILGDGSVRGDPIIQGALYAIDTNTGEPIASIGGIAPWASRFDRTQARRQPGSSVKPFIWLAALQDGVDPRAIVLDQQATFPDGNRTWTPKNYNDRYFGPIPLYEAFERSLNVVSARLAYEVGTEALRATLTSANVYPFNEDRLDNLSSSIGAIETTPRRMAMGMAALDPRNNLDASALSLYHLERMMRGTVERGTAYSAFRNGPEGVAGKTGTSQSFRDAWFVGRTGTIAFAVWVGRDDDQSMPQVKGRKATGGSFAAPIAARFLKELEQSGEDIGRLTSIPFEKASPFFFDDGRSLDEVYLQALRPIVETPAEPDFYSMKPEGIY